MNDGCILVTGGSGKLGKAILAELQKEKVLAPSRSELDITNKQEVEKYFGKHKIDAVIHCAALTDMKECEKNPASAATINIGGTLNLVSAAAHRPETRFIYLSTDYVYPCVSGPYNEKDTAIPFNTYAKTKLGGEYVASVLKNHCIIRTSFFNPKDIPFNTAPGDAYCSKISFAEGAKSVLFLLDCNFVGTINVGRERISLYELLKPYKKDLQEVTLKELNAVVPIKRAPDSSLDISLWKKISGERKR